MLHSAAASLPPVPDKVSRARYDRERLARKEAEHLLELKSRELFESNQALAKLTQSLEEIVAERTKQLVAAREEAELANQRKSDFVAHISHELRTPLNGVIAMADVLCHEIQDSGLRRMSDIILSSGEALLSLLNDLLDLSKIEAGRMDLDPQPFLARPFLERLVEIHRIRAQERGISLTVTLANDLPDCVLGDSHRLGQVLHNLLSNAVKFCSVGGVSLRVHRGADDILRFVVADTGVGMTEEQLSRVFDRFEQADLTIVRKYGGTGLGLAIVRDLLGLMGGTINVRSTRGVGTEFTVEVPLPAQENPRASGPAADRQVTPDLTGLRCLAAEDNGVNREILRALMKPLGLDLQIATNGEEALRAFTAAPDSFDVLLFDMNMPVMDGPAALRSIRWIEKSLRRRALPAIALTAAIVPKELAILQDAGFQNVIAKPVKRHDLAVALHHAAHLAQAGASPG